MRQQFQLDIYEALPVPHEQWREERGEEKFDRVLDMASRLPDMRRQVRADLDHRGLARRRVEAVAIDILDRGVFRVGGEEYADENGTRGAATLLRNQVHVSDRIIAIRQSR